MPLKLKIKILNEKGEVEAEHDCHSWTKQFLQMLEALVSTTFGVNGAAISITDTGGSARTIQATNTYPSRNFFTIGAPAATATYGIVVGTGNNAEAVSDTALQTLISHGVGAGNLQYGANSYVTSTVSGSDTLLVLSRGFTNGSGNTVTINEIGIYCSTIDTGSAQRYFCIARDKLDSGVDVNDGATKTVQYTITTTN